MNEMRNERERFSFWFLNACMFRSECAIFCTCLFWDFSMFCNVLERGGSFQFRQVDVELWVCKWMLSLMYAYDFAMSEFDANWLRLLNLAAFGNL